jgi:hypothetical protein
MCMEMYEAESDSCLQRWGITVQNAGQEFVAGSIFFGGGGETWEIPG